MRHIKRTILFPVAIVILAATVHAQHLEPAQLAVWRKAYPDISFKTEYDTGIDDWRVTVSVPQPLDNTMRNTTLIWAEGKLLPEDKLEQMDSYGQILYRYAEKLSDPAEFSAEELERVKAFGSTERRKSGFGSPQFIFDAIYNSQTRIALEQHIKQVDFLGKKVTVHERIAKPLERVEHRITELAKTDAETKAFLDSLLKVDGYVWRDIRDSPRRSFHSLGIAVDILPKNWGSKIIYWNWEKQRNPDGWMLTPLSKRWMPPQSVIEAFENEGFIWGGKWGIWDNMHFEYRPELIRAAGAYPDL